MNSSDIDLQQENNLDSLPLEVIVIDDDGEVQNCSTNILGTKSSQNADQNTKRRKQSAKAERKYQRNHGKSYVTSNGKTVKNRSCVELPECRAMCAKKISRENQLKIFNAYWSLGCYVKRVSFVKALISIQPKKRCRSEKMKLRKFSAVYHLRDDDSNEVQVCRKCFKFTLGETESFIDNILMKYWENLDDDPIEEKRGRKPKAKEVQ